MRERWERRGVSTVVGTVLLIAVAFILAAAVAAVAVELGGSVDEEARAGIAVDRGAYNLTFSGITLDNSDYVLLRGADGLSVYETPATGVSDGEAVGDRDVFINGTSTRIRLGSGGASASGEVAVVGVIGGAPEGVSENGALTTERPPGSATQTVVREVEYGF